MRTAILPVLIAFISLLGPQPAAALGGDDVTVLTSIVNVDYDLAVASDGTLFALVMQYESAERTHLVVRRSVDGGTVWTDWATFNDAVVGSRFLYPQIQVAEGAEDRVFVAYVYDAGTGVPTQVHVNWSPLAGSAGAFSHDRSLMTCTNGIFGVSLATDAHAWDDYFVYLTWAATTDATGADVYFARATQHGDVWNAIYAAFIATGTNLDLAAPALACGYDGWVHLVARVDYDDGSGYDDVLVYDRAENRAAAGPSSWNSLTVIATGADGWDQAETRIAAAPASPHVMIASTRRAHDTGQYYGVAYWCSFNSGNVWSTGNVLGAGAVIPGDLLFQASSSRWALGLTEGGRWGYRFAPAAMPTNWSDLQAFASETGIPSLVVDPSHDNRIGILSRDLDDEIRCVFDAEWRADPGYPNFEWGFPVDLDYAPTSDPAVVDVDGNGDLEIAFTDARSRICIYTHEGDPLPGWPVIVGTPLSPAPVAIGDMDGDGHPEILVGSADGRVFGYDAGGHLISGFPYNTNRNAPAYVTIASLGSPDPRAAVVAAGSWVGVIDHHGAVYPGSLAHTFASTTIAATPAVGDIDGDGVDEVVVAASSVVAAFQINSGHTELSHTLEAIISGGVTLADFDADGEVEIVAPLANGVVHVLHEDGTEFAGSWPVTVATSALRGAAIADIRYLTTPEVAVTATNWTVALLNTTGGLPFGWPNDTDGWYIYGKPILGRVVGTASSVLVGSRGYRGWAWGLLGSNVEGWPRTFADHIELTPAYGDLDLDGRAEVVFLTTTQLAVVDVGTAPGEARASWPMAAHDPGRTGCWECVEDLVAVDDAPAGITRVSFASPWPNPVSGPTTFAFALPVAAIAELAVYDLRGCRVALVGRSELPAGKHQLTWNGHDRDGHPLASGHYLAALRVEGPGVDETLTRKFTVVH